MKHLAVLSVSFCLASHALASDVPQAAPGTPIPALRQGEVLYAPIGRPDLRRPRVTLAVNAFSLPNADEPIIRRTVIAFAKTFGEGNFEAHVLSDVDATSEGADFILGSAGTFLRYRTKGARDLATLVSDRAPDPNRGEGSLFVVLKDSGIKSFEDLKGKRLAVLGPNAFTGGAVALGEVARRGFDPDKYFAGYFYGNASMAREVDALRLGAADAAVLRTCYLEDMAARGERVSDLAPAAVRDTGGKCLASTELYPNWTLFATPKASPETARLAATALLSMKPDAEGRRWGVASDFSAADDLYRTLRRGPYEYLRTWTLERFWEEWRDWILLAVLLIAGLAAHAARSSWLVRVRTEELRESIAEQAKAEEKARAALSRIEALQKTGVVGQMSSIIAHELRQPLSAIIGFSHGLLRLLDRPGAPEKETLETGLEKIRAQAGKADEIVQKVRSYAKRPASARVRIDLRETARGAADTVRAAKAYKSDLVLRMSGDEVPVVADPLEMELACVNLVKNALEALENRGDGVVEVCAGLRGGLAVFTVTENGPALPDDVFENLSRPLATSKIEGLGLGVSIVKMVVESHGGRLAYERGAEGRGLVARFEIPAAKKEPADG